jgi:hypothetical protein
MNQVHKENLTHVENANPGRQGLEIEIFGMEGVPAEIIDQHNQQVTQAHFAEEQERARVTGNPVRGQYTNGTAPPNKRAKVTESLDEIEQRADKFRVDRKNGVLPLPPAVAEIVSNPVCRPATSQSLYHKAKQQYMQTPPAVQPPFGAPPAAFPASSYPPQFSPANGAMAPAPGSLPGALPPRPGFGAPPPGPDAIQSSIDDLIAGAQKEAPEKKEDKKSKKDKNMRLIYNDDNFSPEEKMARLPRFAEYVRA